MSGLRFRRIARAFYCVGGVVVVLGCGTADERAASDGPTLAGSGAKLVPRLVRSRVEVTARRASRDDAHVETPSKGSPSNGDTSLVVVTPLEGRFRSATLARVRSDGSLQYGCADGVDEAMRSLEDDKP